LTGGISCSDAASENLDVGSHVSRCRVSDRVSPNFDQGSIAGDEQTRQWLSGEIEGNLASNIVMDQETCVRVPSNLT